MYCSAETSSTRSGASSAIASPSNFTGGGGSGIDAMTVAIESTTSMFITSVVARLISFAVAPTRSMPVPVEM
ncbi:hypothetical protein D9M72_498670 [compost metagenome]